MTSTPQPFVLYPSQMLNTSKLYRLPWTLIDNPNGWVEVTTACQLKCPGCYRGLSDNKRFRAHKPLGEILEQVDHLIKERNIQTLAIAGGEPLVYPYIREVVKYATQKDLKVRIFTNGLKLDSNTAENLTKLGVTEFIVHIDRHQKRPDLKDKTTLELKTELTDRFANLGLNNLGFIMPVGGAKDLEEARSLLRLGKNRAETISALVFTTYKDLLGEYDSPDWQKVSQGAKDKIIQLILEETEVQPSAYIGKQQDSGDVAWLFSIPVIQKGKVLGSIDAKLFKTLQEKYYQTKGKYYITRRRQAISSKALLPLTTNSEVRRILGQKMLDSAPTFSQTVIFTDPPEKTRDGWNLCESCPDAMYHQGELVPSCLLERIEAGEEIKAPA